VKRKSPIKPPPDVGPPRQAVVGKSWGPLLIAAAVTALAAAVFWRLVGEADPASPHSDHISHVRLAAEALRTGAWPPHPLYHACLLALSGGKGVALGVAAVAVLALACGARTYLSARYLTRARPVPVGGLALLCFALAVAMPLPNWWGFIGERFRSEVAYFGPRMPAWLWAVPSVYYGVVSPNVWHNPTGIFAAPFALLLFVAGLRALGQPSPRSAALVGGAMVLSALAKPNYVMTFGPCLGVALSALLVRAVRAGRLEGGNAAALLLLAFAPVAVVLWLQFNAASGETGRPGPLSFAPWAVWTKESPNIPASVLLGVAFPLAASLLYWREAVRERPLLLAWATLGVAVAQFALLSEADAARSGHGNFGWGLLFADAVLFVVAAEFLLRQAGRRRVAAFGVLGLHALSGLVCLARCLYVPPLAGAF
jgi:hypothetical protein